MASVRSIKDVFWRCPSCCNSTISQRAFSSATAAQALGPESPRYVDVPEPVQLQKHRKRIVKGTLPVPRNLFPVIGGRTRYPNRNALMSATRDAKEPAGSSTAAQAQQNEFRQKMADLRKRNLREGLQALTRRRKDSRTHLIEGIIRRRNERRELLSRKDREDETLTSPSVTQLMKSNTPITLLSDPKREQRAEEKAFRVQEKERARVQERQEALHTLYMHARNFIVTEKQLDRAIDDTFGTQEQPKTWSNQGLSIWADGPPPNISTLLARASGKTGSATSDADFRERTTQERLKRIAEEFTGGKM